MNKNQEIKRTQKPEPVLVSAAKPVQNDVDLERVFIVPSVPRPGKTSWSLVL